MKPALLVLLAVVLFGGYSPVARADIVTYSMTSSVGVYGSYTLNNGAIFGPWGFSGINGEFFPPQLSGVGDLYCPIIESGHTCATAEIGNGQVYFNENTYFSGIYTDSWIQFNSGTGSISGTFSTYSCYVGDCTPPFLTNFTGIVTATPEPSALLLMGTGLLGIAAFCSLRRRLWRFSVGTS